VGGFARYLRQFKDWGKGKRTEKQGGMAAKKHFKGKKKINNQQEKTTGPKLKKKKTERKKDIFNHCQ